MPCGSFGRCHGSQLSLEYGREEGKPLLNGEVSNYDTMMRADRRDSSVVRRFISTDPSTPKGWTHIILRRTPGIPSLGIGIAGGSDKEFPPVVSCVRAGSIAHRSDGIQVGDFLVAVNGVRVTSMPHNDILTLLRNSGDIIRLDLEYNLNEMYFERPACTYSKATDITLEKEGGSYGFTIRGGSFGPDPKKSRPITVTEVRPGGPADREGRLRVGDRILSINGIDVYSATLSAAAKLLQEIRHVLTLTVEYDVSILETIKGAKGPLLLEIDKPPGAELGLKLSLEEGENHRKSLIIQQVIPASIADRCGALHVKDELIGIDGVSLDYTTILEARQLLRGSSQSGQIKLEIVPHSQIALSRRDRSVSSVDGQKPPSGGGRNQSRRGTPTNRPQNNSFKSRRQQRKALSQDRESVKSGKHKSPRERSLEPTTTQEKDSPPSNPQGRASRLMASDYSEQFHYSSAASLPPTNGLYVSMDGQHQISDIDSIRARSRQRSTFKPNDQGSLSASVSGVPCGQVCHSEVMEVMLNSWARGGFGLILHRSHGLTDLSRTPLFISYIERGSPAEKCGVLQVGDRVLAINEWCTANGTAEEANYIIRHASSPLSLTVEFDVIGGWGSSLKFICVTS